MFVLKLSGIQKHVKFLSLYPWCELTRGAMYVESLHKREITNLGPSRK